MITIRALMILLGLGDLAGFIHYLAHHRTGLAAAVIGAAGWVGNRTHIPLLAAHTGGHRPSSRKARRALRAACRQARKAATAC